MLTHLLIALIGSGVFLRIAAKEKNRRHRHLLLRLAEQEKKQAEQQAAGDAAGDSGVAPAASASEPVITAEPVPQDQAA